MSENVKNGYIYLRWHPSYKQVIKMGKAKCPIDRNGTYVTGELYTGNYIKILRILSENYNECDNLLKTFFAKYNVRHSGGIEFYEKTVYFEIEEFLKIYGITYEIIDINDINRQIRERTLKKDVFRNLQIKIYERRLKEMMKKHNDIKHIELLHDYQRETHEKIKNYEKSIINWACGGGKTYISLYQLQEYKYNTVLIAVPTKILLDQWFKKLEDLLPYYKSLIINSTKEGTTNESTIKAYMESNVKYKCVLTTYHSAHLLVNYHFNLKILDEIHHLCFKKESDNNRGFKRIFDVRANKQIGLTATCKIANDIENIVGNNNQHYYGPIIDNKNINFMIDNKAICDYSISIIGLSKTELRDLTHETIYNSSKTNHEIEPLIIAAYSIIKAIMMKMTHHTLIYCNTCENAQIVKEIIDTIIAKSYSHIDIFKKNFFNENIDGGTLNRNDLINRFNISEVGIIPCVLIFGEGYDNPLIDSVVFAENMDSTIRIVQSGLRPTRLDKMNPNKKAELIIPIILNEHFIDNDDNYCFKKLRQIISEMSTSDENILERIKYYETKPPRYDEDDEDDEKSDVAKFRLELIETSNIEMKLRILRRNCMGKNLYKYEYYELKKLIREFNIDSDVDYVRQLKDKDYYIEEPDIHFFETNLWKSWHDFLDIDISKYPSNITEFKEKCNMTGITDYVMKTKLPDDEFIRLCKVHDLPYFRITDFYKDYQFSNLFIIRQDKGRRKDY
jgi:superfamily II DNA or RNA helicase